MRCLLRRRARRDDSGAVLVTVAAFLSVAMAASAFAIDLGRLTDRKRELQALADLVAIDAARAIEDGTPTTEQYPQVLAAAEESAARNGFLAGEIDDMDVVLGEWVDAARTFVAHDPDDPVTGLLVPDAVRVRTTDAVDYAFAPLTTSPTRLATAVHRLAGAVTPPPTTTTTTACAGECSPPPPPPPPPAASSCVTVGSFLARAEPTAGVLGVLLSDLLGVDDADVAITAAGYEGLATAGVGLDALRAALGLGGVEELLTADVAVGELLSAVATVLSNDATLLDAGLEPDLAALDRLGDAVDGGRSIRLGEVVSVATGHEGAAAGATVDALTLVMATAMVADGDSFLDVDLAGAVPGVLSAELRATIIEPPVVACGPAETGGDGEWVTLAETSQVQAELVLGLDLGLPGLDRLELTLDLSGADARAALTRIACPAAGPDETTLAVDTSALQVGVGVSAGLFGEGLEVPAAVSVAGAYDDLDFVWDGSTDVQREWVGSDVLQAGIGAQILGALPLVGDFTADVDAAIEVVTSALGLRVGGAEVVGTAPLCSTVQLV